MPVSIKNKCAFAGFQQSAKPRSANVTPVQKTGVKFSIISQAGKEKKVWFFFISVSDKDSLKIKSAIFPFLSSRL